MTQSGWQFWVDRGGTFTDIVARRPDGGFVTVKVLSENPERYCDPVAAGIRAALGLDLAEPLPFEVIDSVRIGTTVATNALLERKGARTLLVVNAGFADLLTIGHQTRPKLFDLNVRLPAPLFDAVEEVGGRVGVDGATLQPLDEDGVRAMLRRRRAQGFEAVAVALIHAWRHPQMEQRIEQLAREAGFAQVSISHEVSRLIGLVSRGRTTVVDAYVSPTLNQYVDSVAASLGGTPLWFMRSNGGLTETAQFHGRDAVLSGPAGGVVGAARTAEAIGIQRIIGFDMGGTSTDVCLYAGEFERTFDAVVAGLEMRVPMMSINTVAAGGGSILHFDGARFRVGPDSAGAHPGPACYRRGGPLTVTDANLLLGKIQPRHFPAIFGPNGDLPLDAQIVQREFAALVERVAQASGVRRDPRDIAEGFLRIAIANMGAAIKQVSLEKGHDASEFTLQCFGGAGGQHACLVADELGMGRVLIHPFAGVLSAYGIGLAERSEMREQAIERLLEPAALADVAAIAQQLIARAGAALGGDAAGIVIATTAYLRYEGSDTALPVSLAALTAMQEEFDTVHRRRFGFSTPERPVVIASVVAEVRRLGSTVQLPALAERAAGAPQPIDRLSMWSAGVAHDTPVYDRAALLSGDCIAGPAVLREQLTTLIVEPGWSARIGRFGHVLLERTAVRVPRTATDASRPDPVLLELFANRFMAIAEQMGAVLRNTSTSVNIKERLDFSCALFDPRGNLIANAPHVPVHLGAMGESVRAVLASRGGTLKPGDMIALNNPFNGGTHLPDVTLIAPVFDETGSQLRFFVGNRGHHADVGGITPGSTPPDSRSLVEEGVVIDDFLLLDGGEFREGPLRELLSAAQYPARSPDTNVADLKAQVAANHAGAQELQALIAKYGWPVVAGYTHHVMANAEESIRSVLDRIGDGAFEYAMDDGSVLKVRVAVDRVRREATIDFSGTSAQRPGNFNAPPAVTRAVVLYVFRCLVADDLPLNEGCLAPLRIVLPQGSFLAPAAGSAVVAGNTEVSQAVCNALLGALGAAASSQGTMNNFLFGNDRHQYYETICGGTGAGADFDGATAVHSHMTNTRITDPEVLELRYPVRLETFAIRRGSGGEGRHRGGDGVVRRVRVLQRMIATIVASRRAVPPFGMAGGAPGKTGRQWVERHDGKTQALTGIDRVELEAGDAIVIETPGGGGFGVGEQGKPRAQSG